MECGDTIKNSEKEFVVVSITSSTIFGEKEYAFKTDDIQIVKKAKVIPKSNISELRKGDYIRTPDNLYMVWKITRYDDNYSITLLDIEHRYEKNPRENHFGWLNEVKEDLSWFGGKIEIIENPFEEKNLQSFITLKS